MADVVFVVNNGLDIITDRINGAGTKPDYAGWGTDGTAATATDTDLGTASAEARVQGTPTIQTTNTANDTFRLVTTITSAGSQTIAEYGQFDGAGTGSPPSGANMCIHGTFTGIPLTASDGIQFTTDLVVDQG